MKNYVDLTNKKFNKLRVIEQTCNSKKGERMWICQCDCGNNTIVSTHDLTSGHNKSCGCLARCSPHSEPVYKHSLSSTRLYTIWHSMKQRCYNKNNKSYNNYGGRGIIVCDEWKNFMTFYNWAINNGYNEELTIDRIDNNGNYEPLNCRWVTISDQSLNRRTNKYIVYNNKTKTISQWSKEMGLKFCTLKNRLDKGWSIEKALTTPVKKRNSK